MPFIVERLMWRKTVEMCIRDRLKYISTVLFLSVFSFEKRLQNILKTRTHRLNHRKITRTRVFVQVHCIRIVLYIVLYLIKVIDNYCIKCTNHHNRLRRCRKCRHHCFMEWRTLTNSGSLLHLFLGLPGFRTPPPKAYK